MANVNVNIDLAGRYSSAFGFLASNIIPRVPATSNPYRFETFEESDSEFEDITLSYSDIKLNFASLPIAKAGLTSAFSSPNTAPNNIIAPPPIISFSRKKNLIITNVNDSQGFGADVVERWSNAPWEIRMRGILIDTNSHSYPTELIKIISRLFSFGGTIDVAGTQFTEKDINFMNITSVDINPVIGYSDTIQYSLAARSAIDVGWTLTEPN